MQTWRPLIQQRSAGSATLDDLFRNQLSYQTSRISQGYFDTTLQQRGLIKVLSELVEQTRIPDPGLSPDGWRANIEESANGPQVRFVFSISGSTDVARYVVERTAAGRHITLYANGFSFTIPRNERTAQEVREEAEPVLEVLRERMQAAPAAIDRFNQDLEPTLRAALQKRLDELSERDSFANELNRRP